MSSSVVRMFVEVRLFLFWFQCSNVVLQVWEEGGGAGSDSVQIGEEEERPPGGQDVDEERSVMEWKHLTLVTLRAQVHSGYPLTRITAGSQDWDT